MLKGERRKGVDEGSEVDEKDEIFSIDELYDKLAYGRLSEDASDSVNTLDIGYDKHSGLSVSNSLFILNCS